MNETSSVVFHLPDFIADDVEYTDIQVIVQMAAPTHDTAKLAETLQRPVNGNANE
jgi:hypothetical protein